ncbi:MAG: DUF5103 domain-containing protein [Bacteroidales bacterium]
MKRKSGRWHTPFLQPGSGDQITLSFDIIEGDGSALWYNTVHCDRDWNRSDLFTSDYMEGFEENQVTDFAPSFNTRINYIHYSLSLPNNDVRFLVSGNYVITFWTADEPEKPVLIRRFFISEGTSPASVTFRRPMKPGTTDTHQQAEITVSTGSLPVTDPYRQVTLTIMQNGRPDRTKSGLLPDFVSAGRLEYNTLSDKTLMPGGNEFRYFDIKTIRQTRQNVRAIDFVNGVYHAYLIPSDDREFKPYFFNEDFNGKFVVAMEESRDPDREADYVWVWFTMPAYQELQEARFMSRAAFAGGNTFRQTVCPGIRPVAAMRHRFCSSRAGTIMNIHFSLQVLQFRRDFISRSHWETENDYLVLTYFRDPTSRYDRLTGITLANTRGAKWSSLQSAVSSRFIAYCRLVLPTADFSHERPSRTACRRYAPWSSLSLPYTHALPSLSPAGYR